MQREFFSLLRITGRIPMKPGKIPKKLEEIPEKSCEIL
jgi:hypothetical protein